MKTSKVIIEVRGGIPECVVQPDNVEVIVHDYDIQAYYPCSRKEERAHIHKDEDGNLYWKKTI